MKHLIYIFFVFLLFNACTTDSEKKIDVSGIEADVKITRLEQELFSLESRDEVKAFLENHKLFTQDFLQQTQFPVDSNVVNAVFQLATDTNVRVLLNETQEKFKDMSNVEKEFEQAFKHIKYYYPDFVVPQVHTIITGFGNDIFVSDSLIVIGLDYFLGDKGTYRPDVPQYILRRYRKEYIVPMTVMAISRNYNQTNEKDNTLLGDIIYYGKSYEFMSHMMPSTPDSLIIGYTDKQLQGAKENRDIIWAHFVDKKLLYETSHFTKTKYVDERPYTAEIGSEAPGAIGRWLGWEIVKAYMKEKEQVSIAELMKNTDAQSIFMQSKYKGKML